MYGVLNTYTKLSPLYWNRDDRFQYPMYMIHWEYNPYLKGTIGVNHRNIEERGGKSRWTEKQMRSGSQMERKLSRIREQPQQ